MTYAVITPTYVKHFKNINPYLTSFQKYVADKEQIHLYFIISREEKNEFEKIIAPFQNLNISVLIFEEVLNSFGIAQSPDELLEKFGRFTFQSLKKFYGVLYIPEEKSLVLDCESLWVRNTNMSELFEMFFAHPTIFGSRLNNEKRINPNFNQMVRNIDYLLDKKCPYWFLENYMWFYEKRILTDLCQQYGSPLQLAEKMLNAPSRVPDNVHIRYGIFEISLYQNFLYFNKDKYHYQFVDVVQKMEDYLSKKEKNLYLEKFYAHCRGSCGVTEHVCLLLTPRNIKGLSQMFQDLKIKIFRCDITDSRTYYLQYQFLKATKPVILASSQRHLFGISALTLKTKLSMLIYGNKNYVKMKNHWHLLTDFQANKTHLFQMTTHLLMTIKYAVKTGFLFLKHSKIILWK